MKGERMSRTPFSRLQRPPQVLRGPADPTSEGLHHLPIMQSLGLSLWGMFRFMTAAIPKETGLSQKKQAVHEDLGT